MRQTFKVAQWEIKRNLKNKSFLISLFITPAIIALFIFIPTLFDDSESGPETMHIFVHDELGVLPIIESIVTDYELTNWELTATELSQEEVLDQIELEDYGAYVALTEEAFENNALTIYTSEKVDHNFTHQTHIFVEALKNYQLDRLELSDAELSIITQEIFLDHTEVTSADLDDETIVDSDLSSDAAADNFLRRLVRGMFAGVILFSIVISRMMIFEIAAQEKKDKIAEIIMSSVKPNELIKGKIIGYFALGIIQLAVWMGLAVDVVLWKVYLPIFQYLFLPKLAVLIAIAVLGYLI